jgi:4-amino-4-deoxy-L-arabinose transferase-like glycosyltransferase
MRPGRGWLDFLGGLLIAAATLALMITTEPHLAIVWDEGYTLGREVRLRAWIRGLQDPEKFAQTWKPPTIEWVQQAGAPPPTPNQVRTRTQLLFDSRVLAYFWPFAREEPHGHPPFYALIGLIGDVLTPSWEILPRARLGPMILFSLIAGLIYDFARRRWGLLAGLVAAGAWVLQPNLFAHGHYATYDAILAALWIGAIVAFVRAVESAELPQAPGRSLWLWTILFGLFVGCAADTKLTGWFLVVPFGAWAVVYRNRRAAKILLIGGLVGLVVLYVLNPPWWMGPWEGIARFWRSNLSRAETRPIEVLFLGHVYNTPIDSLPWYNTIVWTVFVTPVGFLILAICGAGRALRRARSEPVGVLIVAHWAFLLALRALPHTPGHDGVRQFLPAFGVLALLAGLGAATISERFGQLWGRVISAAALMEGALSVALTMPVPLSYFSPLVGGLPGAAALGMEPTYYWDALTPEALDWLNTNTPPGSKIWFATNPHSWFYLRDSGRLKVPFVTRPNDPGPWAWYVVQNRPGAYSAFSNLDRAVIAQVRPAFVVAKWGVPLVWIFPFDQVEALRGQTSAEKVAP